MKKTLIIPAVSVIGGAAAFVLRLIQNRTGFEAGTGLPVPGAPAGLLLAGLLAVIGVLLLLLVLRLPKESGDGPAFPASFSTDTSPRLMLPVAGALLIGLSGVLDVAAGLGLYGQIVNAVTADGMVSIAMNADAFSPAVHLLLGILSLLSAGCLFLAAAACRRKEDAPARALNSSWLLLPPVMLVVRLVLTYRVCSVNPSLAVYYVELLALVLLTLGFYRLSSFAFRAGRTRRFAFFAAGAVVLCLATLANGGHPAAMLTYLGGALTLLGFLFLRLSDQSA